MRIHQYRNEIANICHCKHLTTDEIFIKLKKIYPKVWLSTVYRNVEGMAESGILKKLMWTWSKSVYEKNIGTHAHFICEKTGKIYDVDVEDIKFKNLPETCQIHDMDIRIYGAKK